MEDVFARRFTPAFREAMREAVGGGAAAVRRGAAAGRSVDRRLAVDLELFSRGGMRVLDKIERQDYDVLARRPAISKVERVGLLASSFLRVASCERHERREPTRLDESYAYCRNVARSRARNFYYSFVLLHPRRSNAMCAIYAFMRYCDDLSDETGATARAASTAGARSWTRRSRGGIRGHPVWPAFADTVRRYSHSARYFHDMIDGVRSDLEPRRFETFDELYRYCYQVASVVGLATIHIFGFDSPEAPPLAEKCGIAFQLTNILRDVREDLSHGRVYLPAEDLERFGVQRFEYGANFTRLMEFEAARAKRYYEESRALLGLVDRRSRSSLWALIEIYRRLLDRIERSGYRVLDRRIALPAVEKALIAARAFATR